MTFQMCLGLPTFKQPKRKLHSVSKKQLRKKSEITSLNSRIKFILNTCLIFSYPAGLTNLSRQTTMLVFKCPEHFTSTHRPMSECNSTLVTSMRATLSWKSSKCKISSVTPFQAQCTAKMLLLISITRFCSLVSFLRTVEMLLKLSFDRLTATDSSQKDTAHF